MDTSIQITGINRSTPSQMVKDGACQEILNLRYRHGAWRPVGQKKIYRDLQGDNFTFLIQAGVTDIFLHDIDNGIEAGHPNWICYNRLTGQLSLANFTAGTLTALETLPFGTEIRVVFLKRTLIVTCESFLTTYLWSSDLSYTKIATLAVPDVTLSILPDSERMEITPQIAGEPENALAAYLTLVDEQSKLDGSLRGSLMYITAYRLFDGSYILPSIPKYIEVDNTGIYSVLVPTFAMNFARLQATLNTLYPASVGITKDLIDSVCVFLTPATLLHRIDKETVTNMLERAVEITGQALPDYTFDQLFPLSEEFKKMAESPSWYKIHEFNFEALVGKETTTTEPLDTLGYYKNYATRDTLRTDQFTHHRIFSKVAMVYNDRLHLYNIKTDYGLPYIQWQTPPGMAIATYTPGTISVWLKTNLGQVVLNAPVQVPRYADDTQVPEDFDPQAPAVEIISLGFEDEASATQWASDLEQNFVQMGYPTYIAGSARVVTPQEPEPPILARVTFSIHVEGTVGDQLGDTIDTFYYLPGIIGYNDARAYKMQLVVGEQNGLLFEDKLKRNDAMNFAFWVNPLFSENPLDEMANYKPRHWAFSESLIAGTIPQALSTGFDTNRLQVSEIQNPMVFPSKNSYQVGTGDGLALGAASEPLSTGQFGQFPLQAFSSKGIWALEVGQGEVLYQNILPVNGEVVNNPLNVISVGSGVLYTTERGMFLLLGREVKEISEPVEGAIDLGFINLPEVQGAVSDENFISLSESLSQIQFLSYLRNSRVGYDHLNKEVLITDNSYRYSYVFSFESNTWHKINRVYSLLVNAYPLLLGFTPISCENISEEEDDEYIDTLFITRPLNLNAPDIFKKIDRCILRGECSTGEGRYAGFYVFASDDLNTWQFVTGTQRTGGFLQDFLFQRTHGSAKYFILIWAGNILPQGEISRIDLTFSPRWNLKLR